MYLYNRLLYTQELTYNSNIINIHFISNKTMKHKLLGMLALLLFAVHGAWAYEWDGSGTMSDPYLINKRRKNTNSFCDFGTFSYLCGRIWKQQRKYRTRWWP